jgi:hypothetical protein
MQILINMVKRKYKIIVRLVKLLFIMLFIAFFLIYAWAPVYDFPEPRPFSGDKFYNPYQNIDSTAWKKGNFQIQSKVWRGITNGRNNSSDAIHAVYKQLGYDIIVISDYMKINRFGSESKNYIPVYEHGFGLRKTHQVCIGAGKVSWMDYPFYQNRNHKQHVINILKENNKAVALAHPDLKTGYTREDMHYLTNYDLIEVLNQCSFSINHWDAALTAGHLAYIVASDDAHDVFKPDEVGMVCTFINSASLRGDDVIDALIKGKAYGVDVFMEEGSDLAKKAEDHKKLPLVTSVVMKDDTLFVSVSEPFHDIIFFGSNRTNKKMTTGSKTAFYKFSPGDAFIRAEITFPGTTRYYLNPVIRYSGNEPLRPSKPGINLAKTWMSRGVFILIFAIVIMMYGLLKMKHKKRRLLSRHPHYYCL